MAEVPLFAHHRILFFKDKVTTPSGPLDGTPDGNVDILGKFRIGQFGPPATHVNTVIDFKRDIICFGSDCPSNRQFLWGPWPEQNEDDHWYHKIHQLAIHEPDKGSLHELDIQALLKFKSLRKVFVVQERWTVHSRPTTFRRDLARIIRETKRFDIDVTEIEVS